MRAEPYLPGVVSVRGEKQGGGAGPLEKTPKELQTASVNIKIFSKTKNVNKISPNKARIYLQVSIYGLTC